MVPELKKYAFAFNALGDPTRRAIFEKLVGGPMSVAHIAEGLPVSRPAVSQHLKVLREAKLIRMERRGTRSICRLEQEGILAMRAWLDQFWEAALHSFKELAEQEEQQKIK